MLKMHAQLPPTKIVLRMYAERAIIHGCVLIILDQRYRTHHKLGCADPKSSMRQAPASYSCEYMPSWLHFSPLFLREKRPALYSIYNVTL